MDLHQEVSPWLAFLIIFSFIAAVIIAFWIFCPGVYELFPFLWRLLLSKF